MLVTGQQMFDDDLLSECRNTFVECESPVKKEGKTVEEEEIPDEESPGLLSSLHLVSGKVACGLEKFKRFEITFYSRLPDN